MDIVAKHFVEFVKYRIQNGFLTIEQAGKVYSLSQDEIDQIIADLDAVGNQTTTVPTSSTQGYTNISVLPANPTRKSNLDYWNEAFGTPSYPLDSTKSGTQSCQHEFVKYTGLFDQFDHCSKCGVKK